MTRFRTNCMACGCEFVYGPPANPVPDRCSGCEAARPRGNARPDRAEVERAIDDAILAAAMAKPTSITAMKEATKTARARLLALIFATPDAPTETRET